MKIKLISTLLCLAFVLSLCACGGGEYKNDITPKDLADAIVGAIATSQDFTAPDSDFVDFNMEGASELCTDYCVMLSNINININEFGVFRAKSEADAKRVAEICQSYIDLKTESYTNGPQYLPEEYPKIQNAKVKVYGCYVVYTVLLDSDAKTVDSLINEKLSK